MRLNRSSLVLITAVASAAACRRRQTTPTPVTNPTPPPNVPGAPGVAQPAGTVPTTPQSPTGQQVQITGTAPQGPSSIVSVPPTPATGCPATAGAALGPGTVHSETVAQNETWTLEGSPHHLPNGIQVLNGMTLTIAPCAVVLVGHAQSVHVRDGGALMAAGDEQHPIRIGSDNPTPQPGDWYGVHFDGGARTTSRLAWVNVEHGGAGGDPGCILSYMPTPGLDVQNVSTSHCRGFGVFMHGAATFSPTSANLRVTGTVAGDTQHSGAVFFGEADAVRTLPAGTYTPNEVSEIYISNQSGDARVRTSGTWRNPGVRYHVEENVDITVQGPTGPVLTIAPGTTVAFGHGAGLGVGRDAEGGLIADGQAETSRIVFTTAGSDPQPGSWGSIVFGQRFNRTRSRLNFATIEHGGDHNIALCDWEGGSDHALLYIENAPQPTLVQHVRFVGAPADGASIGRAWHGAAVNFADPALGNDFAQAGAACHQTPVFDTGGNCAENAACQ